MLSLQAPGFPSALSVLHNEPLPATSPTMPVDTTAINRQRHDLSDREEVWLFGYGSLIFKADFPWRECRPGAIAGWARRFWQGSHDHRGTPDAPGRVATLVRQSSVRCGGMGYRVGPEVFEHLDYREKNGYLRFMTDMTLVDGRHVDALVYIATEDNAAWLGPAPEDAIARQIARCRGPSGDNAEYLLRLARALRALGEEDPHVFAIEQHLRALAPAIAMAGE